MVTLKGTIFHVNFKGIVSNLYILLQCPDW